MKRYILKYLIFATGLILSGKLSAQQDPMFSQYMFNMLAVNPGYAGSHGSLNVTGLYRNQWVGIDGAPSTQTFFAHSPIMSRNVGVGLSVINDKVGPVRQTMINADYSYTIRVTDNSKLAMGLKAGLDVVKTSFSDIDLTQTNDASFTDVPVTPKANFGFGLYYYSNKYYVGFSAPKLFKNRLDKQLDYSKLTLQQHFFLVGGYIYPINDQLKFKPTTLIQFTGGAPISMDLNASVLYREKFWLGAGYRFGDSFSLIMQVQVNDQLKIGYSFDQTISALSRYNSGTHEIMLSYDFVFKKGNVISPRYF